MLRNYPPYAVTHSAPLEPAPSPTLPVVIDALSTMSLHVPAVAAANTPPPPFNGGGPGACDAPVEVDAADDGAAWHDSTWSAPCVSEGEGELEIDHPDARERTTTSPTLNALLSARSARARLTRGTCC
jgi:hypothetical protein